MKNVYILKFTYAPKLFLELLEMWVTSYIGKTNAKKDKGPIGPLPFFLNVK